MTTLRVLQGDITTVAVDAVVNAASSAMRGGGGVDGAIHAAGGPTILAECIERFPDGLPTGQAGWTTAGDLPARWVIHTVGPNHRAGQRDRDLLESCYRRSLEVADELGLSTSAVSQQLAALAREAGTVNPDGSIPDLNRVLAADALAVAITHAHHRQSAALRLRVANL